jgi:hypothetical protein
MKIILKFFVFSFVSCENGYHLDLHKEYNSYKKTYNFRIKSGMCKWSFKSDIWVQFFVPVYHLKA